MAHLWQAGWDLSILSLAASSAVGFAALPNRWAVHQEAAYVAGQQVSRDNWRVATAIHVAETREKALADVAADVIPPMVDYSSLYRRWNGLNGKGGPGT